MRDTIASVPEEFIDVIAGKLEKSADKNFQHWWYKTYAPFTDTRYAQPNDFRDAIKRLKNWYSARVFYLNLEFNRPDILPKAKNFGTADSLAVVPPQPFTLVSYGEISELTARMQKGKASAFEVDVADFIQAPTGNGGYITPAAVNVSPKIKLAPSAHHDTLILTGINQGNTFTLKAPIDFAVSESVTVTATLPEPDKLTKKRRKRRK
jgi:hypothetical protein